MMNEEITLKPIVWLENDASYHNHKILNLEIFC